MSVGTSPYLTVFHKPGDLTFIVVPGDGELSSIVIPWVWSHHLLILVIFELGDLAFSDIQ
jgi:hypothetical protein